MDHPDQTATITRIRAKYPTPLGAQHAAFLIEVAKALGVFLFRKDSGTHVTLPNGVNVSQDIIVYADREGFDILGDAEGAATPTWGPKGQMVGELVDVSGLGGVTPPTDPPPQSDIDKLKEQIAYLLDRQGKSEAAIFAINASISDLIQRITALEQKPTPVPQLPTLKVKGNTSRAWGHSHSIDLAVIPEP